MSQTMLSAAFADYALRLIQLHKLIQCAADDSAEGDQLRDEMDGFWSALPQAEIALADGLSSDLYYIHEAPLGTVQAEADIPLEIEAAMRSGNPLQMMAEARRRREKLSPAYFAAIQAICWIKLNQPQLAEPFLEAAGQRNPGVAVLTRGLAPAVHVMHAF